MITSVGCVIEEILNVNTPISNLEINWLRSSLQMLYIFSSDLAEFDASI